MALPLPGVLRAADPDATRIVGIGASAGGLDAIERFLAQVPAQSGLAYVVVQHLDPHHKAMLTELLQRVTVMPVREAATGMSVVADAVYVIPPNAELTVIGGVLQIGAPGRPRGLRLPIDVLFCSLARDQGERAVGVVLSGMGADGTLGLQAIKTLGGLTLAQLPETAQFDSMPRSAIAAGCVDIIAAPDELAQRIVKVTGPPAATAPPAASAAPGADLASILELLRERCKHDLSLYKPSTLTRRIERRVAVHGLASIAAYAAFLTENPQELDLLFKEMLIGVTSFFRDPAVWAELKASVLPALIRQAGAGARLRAWVVGCSTGEEAYTLAMAFIEAVADSGPDRPTLQIFGTDINADAIAIARRGCYPARIAADLNPERLARHFVARGDGYVIKPAIRDMVLFAQQDVLLDPPFTRLDFLSCRNLLIYFNAALQRRLIPLFHYSLRAGGVLLLGGSETVGRSQTLFTPLDLKSRFYQRSNQLASVGSVDFPIHRRSQARTPKQESPVPQTTQTPGNLQSLADQLVLRDFAPATVLVSEHGDIVYISGRTGKYLEPAAGKANWNIYVMARPGIRTQLAAAMRQVAATATPIELHGLQIEGDPQHAVDISVRILKEPAALQGMRLIVFRDAARPPGRSRRRNSAVSDLADTSVAAELARAHAEVQALRQEMRASEEELQAANEELQSTNEELQSANEELTTSKEEGQSMNEELQTINAELQSKLDDLALAQSDMQNLLNSTEIATLLLDNGLNVRRYTEQMTRIIHLREADVGRPLSELASTLDYPQLHDDARQTLRTLASSEEQVSTSDGHWYAVRIMPYRTLANEIQGVVITFVDITATKELECRLRGG